MLGGIAQEVIDPRVHFGMGDVIPPATFPHTKVFLAQRHTHHMPPTPPFEPTAHVGTPLKVAGVNHMRPALPPRLLTNAVRQTFGLAPIHRHIGHANAAALNAHGPWMTPQVQRHATG